MRPTRLSRPHPLRLPEGVFFLKPASGAIAGPTLYPELSARVRRDLNGNLPEPFVRIGLRIVRDCVGVAQVFADAFERFHLFLPGLCEVCLAARTSRDSLENAA